MAPDTENTMDIIDSIENTQSLTKTTPERSVFLKHFWTLADSNSNTRAIAADAIIKHLQLQETKEKQQTVFHSDLTYTLKRLVRGLASSRDGARQGFATTLTGLLATFPNESILTIPTVFDLLKKSMEIQQSMKGMEQREFMFGKLFGILAIYRSGRLLSSNVSSALVKIMKELLEMATWRKWFREACVDAFLTILRDVTPSIFSTHLVGDVAKFLECKIKNSKNIKSVEVEDEEDDDETNVNEYSIEQFTLAIGVKLYCQRHNIQVSKLSPSIELLTLLSKEPSETLQYCLSSLKSSSSSSFPRVHSVWYALIAYYPSKEHLMYVWQTLIEDFLVQRDTSTHERKGLAFKIFELILESSESSKSVAQVDASDLLTPNFLSTFYRNASTKRNYLHEAAKKSLQTFSMSNPKPFIQFCESQLLCPSASLLINETFDEDSDDQMDFEDFNEGGSEKEVSANDLQKMVAMEEKKEKMEMRKKRIENIQIWVLDILSNALVQWTKLDETSGATSHSGTYSSHINNALRLLFTHSLCKFQLKKEESIVPTISAKVQVFGRKKLFSLLSRNLSVNEFSVLSRVYGLITDVQYHSDNKEISQKKKKSLNKSIKRGVLLDPLTADETETFEKLLKTTTTLQTSYQSGNEDEVRNAFLLMFMNCGILFLDIDQRNEMKTIVLDLLQCYTDITSKKKAKSSSKATVVLVDLLLSLLSQDSVAIREIVSFVFKTLSLENLITAECLETIINVVYTKKSTDEVQGDENVQDEEHSDSENEESGEEEDLLLAAASQMSTTSNSEDLMLASIVAQVKAKSKKHKSQVEKQEKLVQMHFKLRALDLLQIYIETYVKHDDKQKHVSQILSLLSPLLSSLLDAEIEPDFKVLAERLQYILMTKIIKAKENKRVMPTYDDIKETDTQSIKMLQQILSNSSNLAIKHKALETDRAKKVVTATIIAALKGLLPANCEVGAKIKLFSDAQQVIRLLVLNAFGKKHSFVPRQLFDDMIHHLSSGQATVLLLSPLADIIDSSTYNERLASDENNLHVDEFSLCESFRITMLLLKSQKQLSDLGLKADVIASKLLHGLTAFFANHQHEDEQQSLKPKRLKAALAFALQLLKSNLAVYMDQNVVLELVQYIRSINSTSPVVKNMKHQVLQEVNKKEEDKKSVKTVNASKPPVGLECLSLEESKHTKVKSQAKKKRKRNMD